MDTGSHERASEGIVPLPLAEAGVANRRAQLSDDLIRPGVEVEFVAVKNGAAAGE